MARADMTLTTLARRFFLSIAVASSRESRGVGGNSFSVDWPPEGVGEAGSTWVKGTPCEWTWAG